MDTQEIKNTTQFQNIIDKIICIKDIAGEVRRVGYNLYDSLVFCKDLKENNNIEPRGIGILKNNFAAIVSEYLDIIKADLIEARVYLNNLKQETETNEVLEKKKEANCGHQAK